MALTEQKAKILVNLVSQNLFNFTADRNNLSLKLTTAKGRKSLKGDKVLISDLNSKIETLLKFKELFSAGVVSEELMGVVSTEDFNFIINLLDEQIEKGPSYMELPTDSENETTNFVNDFIKNRFHLLEELKQDLQSMFCHS